MNCKICGKENISPSMGGADICGACDCGGMITIGRHTYIDKNLLDYYRPALNKGSMEVPSELSKENMEFVCEQVHKAYCKYHLEKNGIEYWTKGDYNKLTEASKEYDRRTVKAVLETIHNLITKGL